MTAVTKNPEVMHGTPCFAGTRVPVKSLLITCSLATTWKTS